LTVFVIAHSDSQKLLATIDRIYNALAENLSIVVFDGGSTDDTWAVAKADLRLPVLSVVFHSAACVVVFHNRDLAS
jgi:glycosyltransferase involved in cell wall biosynthesis